MTVSTADFGYVTRIVHDDSAIALHTGKEYLVETRLTPLAAQQGLDSVAKLIEQVRCGAPGLRRKVIEAMVTNETLFFRDVHPFEALRQHIIPAVLRGNVGRISLWSAAASTGQEAYSLALVLRETFPEVPSGSVLASDLSGKVLDRAASGMFTQLEVNRGLPVKMLVEHFDRHGREWQIRPDVRRMVRFRRVNLAERFVGIPPMDVVFLRNLLVYFDRDDRSTLLARIAEVLRPGGYLFLGATENTSGADNRYEQVQIGRSICYRRTGYQERER